MVLMTNNIKNVLEWLICEFNNIVIVDKVFLIGSILTKEFYLINDVDIVGVVESRDIEEYINLIQQFRVVQGNFKLKFDKCLHITCFTKNEYNDFIKFISANTFTQIK